MSFLKWVGAVLVVFACGFAVDVLYVAWMRSVVAQSPLLAAGSSMLLGGCGLFGFTSVASNKRLAIPYLLGLGAGTLTAMAL